MKAAGNLSTIWLTARADCASDGTESQGGGATRGCGSRATVARRARDKMDRFRGKVALITGAGSGIGLATAQRAPRARA